MSTRLWVYARNFTHAPTRRHEKARAWRAWLAMPLWFATSGGRRAAACPQGRLWRGRSSPLRLVCCWSASLARCASAASRHDLPAFDGARLFLASRLESAAGSAVAPAARVRPTCPACCRWSPTARSTNLAPRRTPPAGSALHDPPRQSSGAANPLQHHRRRIAATPSLGRRARCSGARQPLQPPAEPSRPADVQKPSRPCCVATWSSWLGTSSRAPASMLPIVPALTPARRARSFWLIPRSARASFNRSAIVVTSVIGHPTCITLASDIHSRT